MEEKRFFKELGELLESDDPLNSNTSFQLTSLKILALMVFIDENFQIQINVNMLRNITSANALIDLIGRDKIINE